MSVSYEAWQAAQEEIARLRERVRELEKEEAHWSMELEQLQATLKADNTRLRERVEQLTCQKNAALQCMRERDEEIARLRALLAEVRGCRVVASLGTPPGTISFNTAKFEYIAIPRELWERLG